MSRPSRVVNVSITDGLNPPYTAVPTAVAFDPVTLTQLGAFVLVARLGSVRAAANALGVSEPAVSQALGSLRRQFDDDLIVKDQTGMSLTPGGKRLVGIASQMVALGSEAEAAVREGKGAPERLRVVADAVVAELVVPSLLEAFQGRAPELEWSVGVATRAEMPVLLAERLADVAIGPALTGEEAAGIESRPVMRCQAVLVGPARGQRRPARGTAARPGPASEGEWLRQARWLLGPASTDPASVEARLVARFRVPPERLRVFSSQAAAWSAAADGQGVAPAISHLVMPELAGGRLRTLELGGLPVGTTWFVSTLGGGRRSQLAASLCHFLGTPQAMQVMHRPGQGVPPSRFRPPVYVTIWS